MQLLLDYDSSVAAAPAAFKTALAEAVQYLDALILNPITVTLDIGYGEDDGQSLAANVLGESEPLVDVQSYGQVVRELTAAAASPAAIASLPAADPSGGAGVEVSVAQEQAFGVLPADYAGVAGAAGFSATADFDYSTTGGPPAGTFDFLGVALGELTHALGRVSTIGYSVPGDPINVLDLYQYTSPGVLQNVSGQPLYLSTDGGQTNLGNFDTTSDEGDWARGHAADAFNAYTGGAVANLVSPADVTEMTVLGFDTGGTTSSLTADATVADITQFYEGILQRAPDPGGMQSWLAAIDSGTLTLAQVESAIAASSEAITNVVPIIAFYTAFGRAPDAAGLAGWVAAHAAGLSLAAIAGDFLSSPEGQGIYGAVPALNTSTQTAFVDRLYQNVLGRAAEPAGQQAWVAQLADGGMTPAQELVAITGSAEAQARDAVPVTNFLIASGLGSAIGTGSLFAGAGSATLAAGSTSVLDSAAPGSVTPATAGTIVVTSNAAAVYGSGDIVLVTGFVTGETPGVSDQLAFLSVGPTPTAAGRTPLLSFAASDTFQQQLTDTAATLGANQAAAFEWAGSTWLVVAPSEPSAAGVYGLAGDHVFDLAGLTGATSVRTTADGRVTVD
jgi:hypothetical protein